MAPSEHLAKLTLSFFAEFLESLLSVCLGVLHQPTCVGYWYGKKQNSLTEIFLRT